MKLVTVVGARPQFIKASVVSRALQDYPHITEVMVHTGQHYDDNMSTIFFDELGIPTPDYMLNVQGSSHGEMTGLMLVEIERVLLSEKPDMVLVYGDTNTTLAGALAAAKLLIPVAHVEAGARSFNMTMPEEMNRILTDNLSKLLFCPMKGAIEQLSKEGFDDREVYIEWIGDVMHDSAMLFADNATWPKYLKKQTGFVLATVHRAENTNDLSRLADIVTAFNHIHNHIARVVLPIHPRTKRIAEENGLVFNVDLIEPVGYLDFLGLLKACSIVATDSGGVQKEGFFFGKPGVVLRADTEWVELLEIGANKLAGGDSDQIISAVSEQINATVTDDAELFGGGRASQRVAQAIHGYGVKYGLV